MVAEVSKQQDIADVFVNDRNQELRGASHAYAIFHDVSYGWPLVALAVKLLIYCAQVLERIERNK
jgi:hypothetical protein